MNNQITPNNEKETISMNVVDFDSIQLTLASPEDILSWSSGEVTKPETINYRTQKAEKDGLFSEKIFGPVRDYECSCGKYRRIRYKGIICDKCGVEVTKSSVRRERMAHIELAIPVAHIWFLRNIPSRIALILNQTLTDVEKVVYYSSYIITEVDENLKKDYIKQVEAEYKHKLNDLGVGGNDTDQALQELLDSKQQALDFLATLEKWNIISEIDYRLMSMKFAPVFKAATGSAVLRTIFAGIDLEAELKNLEKELEVADGLKAQKIIKKIRFLGGLHQANVRPEWMFLTHLPVIPPDLRPMVALDGGRFATSDLNDLYRRVINRNNRLKKLMSQRAPEVIVRNEKRMLQEAVDALIDNSMRKGQSTTVASTGQKRVLKSLADSLKGKQGRFRQNLLGKRVDYSARSVIVVGPNLKINECGIPKTMALELFKPFIINRLIEDEYAHNIRSATRLIEQGLDIVWDILDEVIEHRYVLLNRAPTLHRLSIQAFKPVLIEGKAIQLNPMVCSPFNADFDGDQMAVHVPLSEEAVREAGELMISDHNLIKPSDGSPSSAPSQDMVLGIYYTTVVDESDKPIQVFRTFNEAVTAYDHKQITLRELVEIRNEAKIGNTPIKTTVGRISFNEILPEGFEYVNEVVGKKQLKNLLNKALYEFTQPQVGEFLDRLKKFGFAEMTRSGLSWAISDFTVSDKKDKLITNAQNSVEEVTNQFEDGLLTEKERYAQIVDVWSKASIEIGALVRSEVDVNGPVFSMIDSGARGSWGQLNQMAGMKGLVVSPSGKIIETPITSSFLKGLTELEYFISTHGARKGLVDTALKTATSGYLTRRLVDVNQDIVVKESDCGDTTGLVLSRRDAEEAGDSFTNFIFGRKTVDDIVNPETKKTIVKAGDFITHAEAEIIDTLGIDNVRIRSLVSCKTIRGVCQSCYGIDLGRNAIVKIGEAVGIVTAQAIGEPATQLTMRTFHQGGSAGAADVTKGLPRVEEVFEARNPKTQAMMSTVAGIVVDVIETAGEIRIKIKTDDSKEAKKSKADIKELVADPVVDIVLVKVGDTVEVGQPITEGHLDLEKLYKHAGIDTLTRYIIQQILEIYNSQGAGIAIKHVEMIVRQMTSRYMVTEPGKSTYLKGQTITRDQLLEFNRFTENKDDLIQVDPLLQGITKVALNTESFLSAASFQNTTKVLIDAALFGKEDHLRGLKENVIIGRLIPAGTGFESER
jgi:DNA-directed RNA polymerase subunit beta'